MSRSCARRGRASRRRARPASRPARRASAGGPHLQCVADALGEEEVQLVVGRSPRPTGRPAAVRRPHTSPSPPWRCRAAPRRACWCGCRAALAAPHPHQLGDQRTPVAALGHEPRVAEPPHQLPHAGRCGRGPSRCGRLAGEPVSGHRRDHHVERVVGVAAVGRRIGQRPDTFSISMTEPGQPWVTISGSAFSCGT